MSPSTLIRAARYWPDDRALELCFAGGRRYLYLNVPPKLAEQLAAAGSKGKFFNDRIKGRFTCHELADRTDTDRRRAAND